MPKIYSDKERNDIRQRLKESAAYCMQMQGIKKTTVDELVSKVQIPKGTFYLFYKTKEELMFEVLLDIHNRVEKEMFTEMMRIKDNVTVDNLTEVIFKFYQVIDDSGILRILTSGEIELLYRKLPPEVLQEHFAHDDSMIDGIIKLLNLPDAKDAEVFSTAFRNLFMSTMYRKDMKEDYFDESLKLTIRGLVIQLINKK